MDTIKKAGRPKCAEPRERRIGLSLSEREYAAVERAAQGMPLSLWVRRVVLGEIEPDHAARQAIITRGALGDSPQAESAHA